MALPRRLLQGAIGWLRSSEGWPLALIAALAAALRFSTLNSQSLWYDESETIVLVRRPLGEMLAAIPEKEGTPPFYFVVAWCWERLFGTSAVGVRSLSALLGTATVILLYFAAKQVVARRAALLASGLAAVNPLLVWYSQEARAYSLLLLLSTLSLLLFLRALRRPSPAVLVAWAACCGLALITHYFAFFLIASEGLILVANRSTRRWTLTAAGLLGVVALAISPTQQEQVVRPQAGQTIRSTPLGDRLVDITKEFLLGPTGHLVFSRAASLAGALFVVALVMLLVRVRGPELRGALLAGAVGAATLSLALAFALSGRDYLLARNILPALPPLLILAGTGLGGRRVGWPGGVAAGAVALLSVVVLTEVSRDASLQREDYRGAARAVGPIRGARAIVLNGAPQTIGLYLTSFRRTQWGEPPVRVQEIVMLAMRRLHAPPPPPPVGGFQQVERRDGASWTLIRYRAANPMPAPTDRLGAANLFGSAQETALLTQPG